MIIKYIFTDFNCINEVLVKTIIETPGRVASVFIQKLMGILISKQTIPRGYVSLG